MSSEIMPGIDTMALAEGAWHGYGTVVGHTMTYAEALSAAGLDWTAQLAPVTALTSDGVSEVDTHRASYRSDTGAVLGVVGADYSPHQPAELLELARLTVDAAPTDAQVEVLGSLRGGRIVFITIALPDEVNIAGDIHVPRLVWATSMDGTLATRAVATFVRAVCMNTIRASFRDARTSWAARHTSSLTGRTADARSALQLVWNVSDSFRHEVEGLTTQTITDHHVGQVLTSLWPDDPAATVRARDNASRRRNHIRRIYQHDPRVAGWHGTAYGLVQAVSTWELWEAPRRGDRGEQILTGLFAGTRTRAVDAAQRIIALA
jgi:phage/plasmid-like protein (TIGR03299 family)